MAYSDYEHCPICDAAMDIELRRVRAGAPWSEKRWHGYKLLYTGDIETPAGMVVLCKEHADALKPHIDALIEQVKT